MIIITKKYEKILIFLKNSLIRLFKTKLLTEKQMNVIIFKHTFLNIFLIYVTLCLILSMSLKKYFENLYFQMKFATTILIKILRNAIAK